VRGVEKGRRQLTSLSIFGNPLAIRFRLIPLLVTLALLICVCPFWIVLGKGWYIYVPPEHDTNLLGNWDVRVTDPHYKISRIVFRPDGTGVNNRGKTFSWGTSDGVLTEKHYATDNWTGSRARYRVNKGGLSVEFDGDQGFLPIVMTRSVVRPMRSPGDR
jgi:hypothetical protein